MPYTFIPEQKHAKAYILYPMSVKSATVVCRAIKKKPLVRAKRLLEDLHAERRSLQGKYYSKSVKCILEALNSCEKNAYALGLDTGRLMVHASAHLGPAMRRRRRKSGWGNRLKRTYLELMLIEKGKEVSKPAKKGKEKTQKQAGEIPKAQEEAESVGELAESGD